eukprot:Gb_38213 [translate_table: standard]
MVEHISEEELIGIDDLEYLHNQLASHQVIHSAHTVGINTRGGESSNAEREVKVPNFYSQLMDLAIEKKEEVEGLTENTLRCYFPYWWRTQQIMMHGQGEALQHLRLLDEELLCKLRERWNGSKSSVC